MDLQQKAESFNALGNQVRLKVLEILSNGEQLSVAEIAQKTDKTVANVNAVITKLYSNKLVNMQGDSPRNKTYSLNKEKINSIIGALQKLSS